MAEELGLELDYVFDLLLWWRKLEMKLR
jgi:hypothetical protein